MANKGGYTFEISLSVLDHLGRKLYRNFSTVLGEAISNSWDAGANNVWIYINKDKNSFYIKDDGEGMNSKDFQEKFLKVGYSKRQNGVDVSPTTGRPYIGRKGIGKLALLSCADKIHIISKSQGGEYVGGIIDNKKLDKAITKDVVSQDYPLDQFDTYIFHNTTKDHKKGTILYFEDVKEGIKNSLEFLRKTIALYFRFSLLDRNFNIFLEDKKITFEDLNDLANRTEFLWTIGNLKDPYIDNLHKLQNVKRKKKILMGEKIAGFFASVIKPKDLNILTTDGRVGVDLFVNGRLREKDILKHTPTAQIPEDYLYGQIHFDGLDKGIDRFTSSREGVIADDKLYKKFIDDLKIILKIILNDWDTWRIEQREEGDAENKRITREERTSKGLYNAVSEKFELSDNSSNHQEKSKIDKWVADLSEDATFNLPSYAECFISENLIRKHLLETKCPISSEAKKEIDHWKQLEKQNKNFGNVNIDIRKLPDETSYLSMDGLANLLDKPQDQIKNPGLSRDAKEYKPIRDALMHTALLTDEAKNKLITIKSNIKGRVKSLLLGN